MTTSHANSKALGAYYTTEVVADFLVRWGVRSAADVVLDPSFGGGVFLRAAYNRIATLGGDSARQALGVELDKEAFVRTTKALRAEFGARDDGFQCCDFFELDPGSLQVDVVVGNPPFIRYHRFSGDTRRRALQRALSQGVELSELTSSWAPFLVHAVSMIKPGGRLAVVLPFELGYALYARPVLSHLAKMFGKVTLLTFRNKLFQDLSEETVLVLAEDKGSVAAAFTLRNLSGPDELAALEDSQSVECLEGGAPLAHAQLCSGEERLNQYFLPKEVRELYERLKKHEAVRPLGELAAVGIGYVTGDNDFFHLSPAQVDKWNIPAAFLKRAVRRGRILSAPHFTDQDWKEGLQSGETGYLLYIEASQRLSSGAAKYIEDGEARGVAQAYKCRARVPWYCVPHVYCPEAFLTYMSGLTPRLVANAARLVAPNSLHTVRIHRSSRISGEELTVLWHNSLTRLSAEIEGHSLGGGMLKLEPTEARNVLLPVVKGLGMRLLSTELDSVCRSKGWNEVVRICDERILRGQLGLSKKECELLGEGASLLSGRRYGRTKGDSNGN